MKKATISVGVGRDKNGAAMNFAHVLELREKVLNYAAKKFGGCTVTENYGVWCGSNGVIVSEESWDFIVVSDTADERDFSPFAVFLREVFNQEAVLLVVVECLSRMV